jgi:uncharacterized protein YaeQ
MKEHKKKQRNGRVGFDFDLAFLDQEREKKRCGQSGREMSLNILQHKSWHVWTQKNIEKVRKDQEEHRKRKRELDIVHPSHIQLHLASTFISLLQ